MVLPNSEDLPQQVLRRLGFWEEALNNDWEEALQLFWNTGMHKRLLNDLQLAAESVPPEELLRSLLLSPRFHGQLQLAPGSSTIRQQLQVKEAASEAELMEHLKLYVTKHQLRQMRTLNGLVTAVSQHIHGRGPSTE